MIGTAGGAAKVAIAERHGCDLVIDYRQSDFVRPVLDFTNGRGVHVVYDAVGRDVFFPSLDCMRVRGLIASYGAASGPVEPLDIQLLHERALFVTRPTLRSYISCAEELQLSAGRFFSAVASRQVSPTVDRVYPLENVAEALPGESADLSPPRVSLGRWRR